MTLGRRPTRSPRPRSPPGVRPAGRRREDQLDHFRREPGPGQGLSSYPPRRRMPDVGEFPTVSMGLGPISAIYQARYNRYLHNRGLLDTSGSRVCATRPVTPPPNGTRARPIW